MRLVDLGAAVEGTRAERQAEVEAGIEAAALELFAARGFNEVTVADIARAAGVSRATVFRHYPSKESILLGNQARQLQRLGALLAGRPAARTSVDELREVVRRFADELAREGGSGRRRIGMVLEDERLRTAAFGNVATWAPVISGWLAGDRPPSLRQEVLGSVVVEALLLGARRWHEAGSTRPLRDAVDEVFGEMLDVGSR